MILRAYAERLLGVTAPAEIVDLHLADTVAAFLTGARTKEGAAIARLYRGGAETERAAAAAAIARLSESDDIHLASCITPGAVVIPVALALSAGRSAEKVANAVAAGYAAGLAIGLAIGGTKALANGVWPTLVAAPLMAAVTASCLTNSDPDTLAHTMALALAGTNGRIGRPMGAPSGRWLALAEAVAHGIIAARAAAQGFRGDLALLSAPWLASQAGHDAVHTGAFESGPAISDTGFKPYPIARQGANAVIAFQRLLAKNIDPAQIESIEVFVPQMNLPLLQRPIAEDDRLSLLCNMGLQFACAALAPARLYDAERGGAPDERLLQFAKRVTVSHATDLDAHLPDCWPARVIVTAGGIRAEDAAICAPFDAGAPGLKNVLAAKWNALLPPGDARILSEFGAQTAPDRYAILCSHIERRLSAMHTS